MPSVSAPSRPLQATVGAMILAEEILLLLTDDGLGRRVVDSARLDLVLAGALLLDLAVLARVGVAAPGEPIKAGRLVVRDLRPVGDPVLDQALSLISAAGPKKPEVVLPKLRKGLRPALYVRLVDRGILRCEERKTFGIFRSLRWPAVDSRHEVQVRARLREVLVLGRTPVEREVAIISLLHAVDQIPKVVGTAEVGARELRRRAKAMSGGIADEAVRRAVEAMTAAVLMTMAATSAAS